MKAKKVLKMLKTKIDRMPEGCSYLIETSDIEAINKVLKMPVVSNMFVDDDVLGFAEHCRLENKPCTYEELYKWKK